MRSIFNPDRWPVEDATFAVASGARRWRRKVARRKGLYGGGAVAVLLCWLTITNGLWGQSDRHPAPIFDRAPEVAGEGGVEGLIAAHNNSAEPSPLIRSIQERLAKTGHFFGAVDGIMTAATRMAIEDFELDAGLPVTGRPTLALLTARPDGGRPAPSSPPHVRAVTTERVEPRPVPQGGVRQVGQAVDLALVQQALNAAGFGPLSVDGMSGPKTRAAISRFALSRGMPAEEGLSPALLAALGVRR